MSQPHPTSRRWIAAGVFLVAAVPLGATWLLRRTTRARDAQARRAEPAAPRSQGVRCTGVSPGTFMIEPGGKQELTARFSGGSGALRFSWASSGGELTALNGEPGQPVIAGYVYLDDFDDGIIDEKLWRAEMPDGASLVEKNGMLMATAPGGGTEDSVVRLESLFDLTGDFAVEVTIRSLNATGNRGGAPLDFLTQAGFEAHVQALSNAKFIAVEANARTLPGGWQTSSSLLYQSGFLRLRILRGGSTVTSQYDLGSGYMPLNRWSDVAPSPGRIRMETWSLDDHPRVEAAFDNFGAAQNSIVIWKAPEDATPGNSYTIKMGDGCEATAVVRPRREGH